MSMLEYDEVVPWSRAMMVQVLEGSMPPWLPAEGIGDFASSRSLSAAEVDLLIDWAVGELPEGDPLLSDEDDPFSDETDVTSTPLADWSLGEPDLVLRPRIAITLEADAIEKRECLTLPIELEAPRLASAIELKPGLPTVMRRATLYQSTSCDSRERPLLTWLPDRKSLHVAHGLGELLRPGSALSIEILYRRGWKHENERLLDRPEAGIWFASAAEPVRSVRVTAIRHSFEGPVEILAIYPDPEDAREPFRVEIESSDGTRLPLLVIERYDPSWREKYQLRGPVPIPEGARVRLSGPAAWLDFRPSNYRSSIGLMSSGTR
jgi:hypothetical protein